MDWHLLHLSITRSDVELHRTQVYPLDVGEESLNRQFRCDKHVRDRGKWLRHFQIQNRFLHGGHQYSHSQR